MTIETPAAVIDAIAKLEASDKDAVEAFIGELKGTIAELKGEVPLPESDDGFSNDEENAEGMEDASDEPPFPPMYSSGNDFDKASDLKMQASDLKSTGNFEGALAKYTEAVLAADPSALLYANRADCLLKLSRPRAAINDCDAALKMNPDSAKALRIRGTAKKDIGDYEAALKDLSASQAIDYNDQAAEDLKFCSEKHLELEREHAKKRNEEHEKKVKKAQEIKKAQEEARREAATSASASSGMPMPGMGGVPGGMGGMADLMNDPEIAAGLSNPKVQAAMMGMMTGGSPDPAKMMELMSDPEVGPIMQKIMAKLGGGSGMGGMGMGGGMPDIGDDDSLPDLDDLPDLE